MQTAGQTKFVSVLNADRIRKPAGVGVGEDHALRGDAVEIGGVALRRAIGADKLGAQ